MKDGYQNDLPSLPVLVCGVVSCMGPLLVCLFVCGGSFMNDFTLASGTVIGISHVPDDYASWGKHNKRNAGIMFYGDLLLIAVILILMWRNGWK